MTTCCSLKCEKRFDCAKHCFNKVGTYPSEDYYSFGHGSISNEDCTVEYWCGELGNYKMFEPIEKKTDYHQWKEWLDKWNINYEEMTWHPNSKELIVEGNHCLASIVFDLEDNFKCMTAYE